MYSDRESYCIISCDRVSFSTNVPLNSKRYHTDFCLKNLHENKGQPKQNHIDLYQSATGVFLQFKIILSQCGRYTCR